jgi:hypothetical protein
MNTSFDLRGPLAALAAAGALLLAGCGDSPADVAGPPDTPPAAADEVQATAAASPGAYTSFAASLPPTETGRPLKLDQVPQAPTSETASPQSI